MLSEAVDGADADVQVDRLARRLAELEAAKKEIGLEIDEIAAQLWEVMADKEVVVDGVGTLTKRSGKSRKQWDHDYIWGKVGVWAHEDAAKRIIPVSTGEVTGVDPVEAALKVARSVVSQGSYRTTVLADRGLDPDDVSSYTLGKKSIQIS